MNALLRNLLARLEQPAWRWAGFVVVVVFVWGLFSAAATWHRLGHPLMPLDDVYIHFQYARQLAEGQPYQYNPGEPPTSGATSLLYPYLLALGHSLGWRDLLLGDWALALGMFTSLLMAWAVEGLARQWGNSPQSAYVLALLTVAGGAFAWHLYSGMETGFVLAGAVLTIEAFVARGTRRFAIMALILGLFRPEASLLAVWATLVYGLAYRPGRAGLWLILPVAAVLVQPVVNGLVTGSVVATGNQSKSILAAVPFDAGLVLQRILANGMRMLTEWLTGYGDAGWHALPAAGLLAVGGLWMIFHARRWALMALLVGWGAILVASISTLDNAFWHFRRYQQPFYLIGWLGIVFLLGAWSQRGRLARRALVSLMAIFQIILLGQYVVYYAVNVDYVYRQPYQMANWLRENTPLDAVVAVHDVGLMRYAGERTTLDIVGLTTPGAAQSWRNGPGSVVQFLLRTQPDYIAAYGRGHGYGLGLLAQTRLYAQPLAQFSLALQPHLNVALAADSQAIYQPVYPVPVLPILPYTGGAQWLGVIDVADTESEAHFEYSSQSTAFERFATEPRDQILLGCAGCQILDSIRHVTGDESFMLHLDTETWPEGDELLLITRLHAAGSGSLHYEANGQRVAERLIIAQPGVWQEVPVRIPAMLIKPELRVRIVPLMENETYQPGAHFFYRVPARPAEQPTYLVAEYDEADFSLASYRVKVDAARLTLEVIWFSHAGARGDYRWFVHLYDDLDQPPVAQADAYPYDGALPPANWLPGRLYDKMEIAIADLQPGFYHLAIGFYDPVTGRRLVPHAPELAIQDDRLLLQRVEIIDDGR